MDTKLLTILGFILSVIFVTVSSNAYSDNKDTGQVKLLTCVACHGADGIGKSPQYPNLNGQKLPYLIKQLKAFRSGERKAPDMARMARMLTDEEIAYVAEYYSKLAD
ncbi:MAG: cytochrome c [Candidatus Thiodiazotropha sp. (ex. Lucinisca nassula)]|uniref:c-type cytochrome n=1 Tax=Candidatus Thiodiazotropha sp. LNASS1 TaxID=3096260 RepID=UPI002812AE8A|nr:cytochrome c [Candidatus Thiodiazotropha sp. (ex. Lucinisca nassula)]